MKWYCKICKARQISCLGSDPKDCAVPIVSGLYYAVTYITPVILITACLLFERGEHYAHLGILMILFTVFKATRRS